MINKAKFILPRLTIFAIYTYIAISVVINDFNITTWDTAQRLAIVILTTAAAITIYTEYPKEKNND